MLVTTKCRKRADTEAERGTKFEILAKLYIRQSIIRV